MAQEGGASWADFLEQTPLSEAARRDIARLYEDEVDYLAGLSLAQKRDFLRSVSYEHFLLFPDGNASIARLLVRALNPRVAPGSGAGMEGIVSARFDYSMLDREDISVRIRLESPAVHVAHVGEMSAAKEVDVTYVHAGVAPRIRARHCVLACYNVVIPYLCPELPEKQRQALSQSLKAPLVYASVLIRDWTSFERLGMRWVECPGAYWDGVELRQPVTIGDYRPPQSPHEPIVLLLLRAPLTKGLSAQEQWRAGRAELLRTSFETFEREIRDQLGRMLGPGGFDPARDIEAITVNRWPHGYAYGHDPETGKVAYVMDELPPDRQPWRQARRPYGRITIANSDAAANAMTESALGQAYRAVTDLW